MIMARFKLKSIAGESRIKEAHFSPITKFPNDLGNVPESMTVTIPIEDETSMAELCVGKEYTFVIQLALDE